MTDAPPPSGPRASPRPSAPGKVKSAARAEPLPEEAPQKLSKERLKEGAADTALNVLGILRDFVDDFRNSDRFFKYKAAVLAGWLLLSVTSVGVACPSTEDTNSRGSFGARLIISDVAGQKVFQVKNDSEETWENVSVLVNNTYQTTVAQVVPYGDIGLTPRLLVDRNTGASAPSNLVFTTIVVTTDQGSVTLFKNGVQQ